MIGLLAGAHPQWWLRDLVRSFFGRACGHRCVGMSEETSGEAVTRVLGKSGLLLTSWRCKDREQGK